MIPTEFLDKIKTQAGQGLNIPVVDAFRTEGLPTPSITVVPVSIDLTHPQLRDVFNSSVSIKYEEHYADITTEKAKDNFDAIISNFNNDDTGTSLRGTGYTLFDFKIESASIDVINDIIVHELIFHAVIEFRN